MHRQVVIVWFKRDLRLHDHAPLNSALNSSFPVIPLYVVEPDYWQAPFASWRHWFFIHDCLTELRQDCARLGQGLVVRVGEITSVLAELSKAFEIKGLYAHEETGNDWTYQRDIEVAKWCKGQQISFNEFPSNGVVRRLKSRDNWSAVHHKRMAEDVLPKPQKLPEIIDLELGEIPSKNDPLFSPERERNKEQGYVQQGGRRAAVGMLKSFLEERGKQYLFHLSAPGESELFCSRLSPHLTWGTLSVREVMHAIKRRRQGLLEHEKQTWARNLNAIESRLSWRCHFIQKLEDQPSIEYRCMHSAYEGLRDETNNDWLDAWQAGQTGYPLIDACMRQLTHTGWITFRMRALLVSFACYHLWLDWRKVGYVLARLFTDYEPGIHYSQLQMQAGVTGINAVRMYNPIKQSYDQDPKGYFIRTWVKELAAVPDNFIHEPWLMNTSQQANYRVAIDNDYPAPIVNHERAIKSARQALSLARRQPNYRNESALVFNKLGSRKKQMKRTKRSINSVQLPLI